MKNKLQILAALGMMSAMTTGSTYGRGSNDGSIGNGVPDNKPKIIPKGCKEYTFYGVTVVALNRKSAKKKAAKLVSNIKR